jgi:DNA polymerase
MADGRLELYRALSLVEDCLRDGYDSRLPDPALAEAGAGYAPPAEARASADDAQSSPTRPAPRVAPRDVTRDAMRTGDSLEAIAAEALRCGKCRLAQSRMRAVPGQGVKAPQVLIIGEFPTPDDDERGLPFCGPAGELLDKMLSAIGLSRRTNCYLTYFVKCKPPERDASPDEQAACVGYLHRQIDLLKPQALLALGRIPAQNLLGTKEGISKLRGTVWDSNGIPCVPTFSPSAILRDESLKRPAWEDLKLLKSVLTDA